VLGLAPAAGVAGGYRAALLRMLQEWQDETNGLLARRHGSEADPAEVRVAAL
jgi:hypothetical protein